MMRKILVALAAVLLPAAHVGAVTITITNDPQLLGSTLLGPGISISQVRYTGAPAAAGIFSGGIASGIGIERGVLLTTGDAAGAVGPNTDGGFGIDNGLPGFPALDDGNLTADATVLEFDFESSGGDVFFNYVFASDEYNEFVDSEFNDTFAFLLDGINIATIPGSQGLEVAINSVNCGNPFGTGGSFCALFNNNDVDDGGAPFDLQYDGFTDVLTAAFLDLSPGTHQMTLAIADRSDGILDSAVFLQAGSLSDEGTNPSDVPPTAVIRLTRTDGTPIATPTDIPDTDAAAGEAVRLDGTASAPGTPSSPLTAYHWTVNGQLLTQQTATVDVRLPDGPSAISLVVEDQLERTSGPAAQQASVAAPNPPGVAVISLNGTPVTGGAVSVSNDDFVPGETVTFSGAQSTDPNQDPIVLYTWRLNGTQVQSGTSPTAALALRDGTNTIELTITDNRGGTGSTTITANVAADVDLGDLPGLTANERSVGRAISELCPRMNELPSESLTTGQRDFLTRCNSILNDEDSNAQRGAVQALTPDQITSQQTTGVDFSMAQLGNLSSRLAALRQGAGRGISAAGLSIRDSQGRAIPIEHLAALARHLTGGASGDEDDASLATRWGIFVNGNVIDGEKDETANEEAFDFGGYGISAGFDYRITDSFVLGLSLGYNESESDFAADAGSLDSEGMFTSAYGTYFNERWYADFIATLGDLDYDSVRRIAYTDNSGAVQAVASGVTGGDLSTLGVSFGYDFNKGGWTFGPTAALTSIEVEIDPYSESTGSGAGGLNMAFGQQRAESRTAQGGFQVGYAMSREWGVLSPQMRLSFVKEFENESQILDVRFVNDPFANNPTQPSPGAITIITDDPDEEYLRWAVGLTFVRTNGFSAFVDYEGLAGMDTVSSGELTFGLRFERSFE